MRTNFGDQEVTAFTWICGSALFLELIMRVIFADPEVVACTEYQLSAKRHLFKLKICSNLADPQVRKSDSVWGSGKNNKKTHRFADAHTLWASEDFQLRYVPISTFLRLNELIKLFICKIIHRWTACFHGSWNYIRASAFFVVIRTLFAVIRGYFSGFFPSGWLVDGLYSRRRVLW